MGFITKLFGSDNGDSRKYRSSEEYAANRSKQLSMSPQTVAQLRNYGVTDQTSLKLEYFFYTNQRAKAEALNKQLNEKGYTGEVEVSASNAKEFIVNGWTDKMLMSEDNVVSWTASMCDIGQSHDCEFDGWGTNPKQKD